MHGFQVPFRSITESGFRFRLSRPIVIRSWGAVILECLSLFGAVQRGESVSFFGGVSCVSHGLRQRKSSEELDCSFFEPSGAEADEASSLVKGHLLRLFWTLRLSA